MKQLATRHLTFGVLLEDFDGKLIARMIIMMAQHTDEVIHEHSRVGLMQHSMLMLSKDTSILDALGLTSRKAFLKR